jgi:hypothetical protein
MGDGSPALGDMNPYDREMPTIIGSVQGKNSLRSAWVEDGAARRAAQLWKRAATSVPQNQERSPQNREVAGWPLPYPDKSPSLQTRQVTSHESIARLADRFSSSRPV